MTQHRKKSKKTLNFNIKPVKINRIFGPKKNEKNRNIVKYCSKHVQTRLVTKTFDFLLKKLEKTRKKWAEMVNLDTKIENFLTKNCKIKYITI